MAASNSVTLLLEESSSADSQRQERQKRLPALRDAILADGLSGDDGSERLLAWEALLCAVPTAGAGLEYERLVQLGPSRLHYKILLDLPRTLKGEPAVSAPAAGPARMRLLDAFVHWFDSRLASSPVEPAPTPVELPAIPASPEKRAAVGADATTSDILGDDIDDDWDAESAEEEVAAPARVLPSAVKASGVLPLSPKPAAPVQSPHRAAALEAAGVGADVGGYAQGMGSLAATLLCALPAAPPPSPPHSARAPVAATASTAPLQHENRAFALLQALAGPHGLSAPPPPLPLWVRGFYEPGNALVRRGCALADDVLVVADPELRAHITGGWGGVAGAPQFVFAPHHAPASPPHPWRRPLWPHERPRGPHVLLAHLLALRKPAAHVTGTRGRGAVPGCAASPPPPLQILPLWDGLLARGAALLPVLCAAECVHRRSELMQAGRAAISTFQGGSMGVLDEEGPVPVRVASRC